ncbi:MAG TPA: efflux RND transporter permease subunit [Vicinamibacterales bacterium]|nr:efflux RND transporter permease subunit [Vicinamibacterales bacterium]
MSLAEFCVRRPAFTTVLVMALVVTGIFSFRDLTVDLLPKADQATVTVTVKLPGASPDELSSSVAEPLEQALSGVAGVDEIQSKLGVGIATLTIKFVLERDINEAAQDVREKVAGALGALPREVLPPVVAKVDPDAQPIYTLAVGGPYALRTLTEIADKQISRALEAVDGVGDVSINGGRAREVHVELDLEKLTAHGLSVSQVRDAIQGDNVEIPGGRIDQGDAEIALRTPGRFDSVDQFNQIVVATQEGAPIRVADVAKVSDSEDDARTSAFISGQRAVLIEVRRQSGQNTLAVIDGVKKALKTIQPQLPPGLTIVPMHDDSRFIDASIASLEEHLILGSILASLIVLLFIRNIPAMLISSLAIPASLVATFTLMRALNLTLNTMTLLGLTLAVGIVIDDAIVVLENIFRKIDEEGLTPFRAAVEGTGEVLLAVAATSLSLVVIFLPVAFMTGYAQRFIYPFGITMAFAIMVSFLVSVTLTPMLGARMLRRSAHGHRARDERFYRRIDAAYARSVRWSLDHRGVVMAIAILTFAATWPLASLVGRSFLPNEDQGEFEMTVDAPEGTSLQGMEKIVQPMGKLLETMPGVASVTPTIFERVNHSHLIVQLKPLSERRQSQEEIATAARKAMASYSAYRPTVVFRTPIGGGESSAWPILVNLYGPDLNRLSDYALKLNARLQALPQFVDVKARVNLGNPELRVNVDRQRAADLGVRVASLAGALRLMVSGEDEITSYRENTERYPVKIRVREDQRNDVEAVSGLMVPSTTGALVRIDNVATLERGTGPTSIMRLDRQFSVGVSADIRPGQALDATVPVVRDEIRRLKLPSGYRAKFAGQSKVLDETAANMIIAISLASIFVYMVLVAQFESFVQPIIIMTALPLSVPFALLTLALTHRQLNLWSTLGVLLLLGIVKKNSILQVDYTNVLRRRGVPLREALIEASRTRLRPILMTTAAIIVGLVPTALGRGAGARQRGDIAVTIIGGQTLCLFLTLLLVPVAYSLTEEARERLKTSKVRARLGRVLDRLLGRPASEPAA